MTLLFTTIKWSKRPEIVLLSNMLKFAVVAICCLAVSCSGRIAFSKTHLDGRIVGGVDAKIEDYPYQILLNYNGRQLCGGSIVSENIVITAAHCTYNRVAKSMTVVAGSTKRGAGTTIQVKEFIRHPLFNMYDVDFDIAILFLATPLRFSDTIAPIDLPEQDEDIAEDTLCTITGWGALKEGGGSPSNLQKVVVPVVNQQVCAEKYEDMGMEITEHMFCAGLLGVGGKDACQGDSGGPLQANGKLAGIVSWGNGCARKNYPGVYTNVASLRDWIRDNADL